MSNSLKTAASTVVRTFSSRYSNGTVPILIIIWADYNVKALIIYVIAASLLDDNIFQFFFRCPDLEARRLEARRLEAPRIRNCFARNSYLRLKNLCEDKTICFVRPSSKFFGDPCPGVSKYLKLSYYCFSEDR